ncbi:MAG: hypothetical protein AAF191_04360 [Verrucomicrobiota bacterium]
MESSLPDLLSAVNDGRVLTPEIFGSIDFDEVLEAREGEEKFDTEWNRCLAMLEKEWSDREINPAIEEMVDEVREQTFEVASANTDQHDLANHISDDFDLFARAIVLEMTDPFLESLWENYENGEIPSPASIME